MYHARADYERIQDPAEKIPADEPVFLIRGQDAAGAAIVRCWADLHEEMGGDPELSKLARDHADRMDAWPTKKAADR